MYTILLTEDNQPITTIRERIMQRSKLVDSIRFLVEPTYKERDLSEFTVTLEYLLPVSRTYRTETLTLSDELYNDYLQYFLDADTNLTAEAGDVEYTLTFTLVELDADGNGTQYVRKTSAGTIKVLPVAKWADIIPDEALSALDQRILKTDAQIKALSELGDSIDQNKADNIKLTENTIQLTSNGSEIGDPIDLSDLADNMNDSNSDGIVRVVEF